MTSEDTGESEDNKKLVQALVKQAEFRARNNFLEQQINLLSGHKNIVIFGISAFLLKTQLVEFLLKNLLVEIDMHIAFSNHSKLVFPNVRSPSELDEQKMTLGVLNRELHKYKGSLIHDLQELVSKMVGKRNKFVHNLFNNKGTLPELTNEATDGLSLAEKILDEMDKVKSELKKNDPFPDWHKRNIKE